MKKTILFILFSSILFGDKYPSFSAKDFLIFEKKHGQIAKNRAFDYQKQMFSFSAYSKTKQLHRVNSYLNQLLPQYDAVMQKQEDYWASPKEFLATGYGDCEDYVIIKYFSLLKLGFDKDRLFLTTVYELYTGGYHMVLTYFEEGLVSPLVLDNLSFRVLPLDKRKDIQADTFINEHGVFRINEDNKLSKIAHHSTQFVSLMKKVRQNR